MILKKHFLLLIVITALQIDFGSSRCRKIVNGRRIPINYVPFLVGIYYFDMFICAGTFITSNMVLTAGHCVCEDFTTPESILIRAGTTSHQASNTSYFLIRSIKCHESLSIKDHIHDIALVKIQGRFTPSESINKIQLVDKNVKIPSNAICQIAGWGFTKEGDKNYTPTLRAARVPLANKKCCKETYKKLNVTVTDNMICAGSLNGAISDTCKGDSGGPLVYKGIQIGIVSFGYKCGEPCYPGVYVDLTKYGDWIFTNLEILRMF